MGQKMIANKGASTCLRMTPVDCFMLHLLISLCMDKVQLNCEMVKSPVRPSGPLGFNRGFTGSDKWIGHRFGNKGIRENIDRH